ncbi:Yip1 domain [Rubrobacter radiotolerans]|uniref:YIP1 family protein n=1 Tax=Rubrobacter radiotolerans TaxID=42256 RepID=A0A023X3U0_RUBRA|nr:YIP1 family protein [Rubrobacter radiotolerans]AHY47127.1 Yip1 domain [Rubrobacter radiotolerans]MDX5894532.1 YIP1 family protein [Rubrobacter radiotolerans]SMC06202.1 hypothetical protein SAMN00767673_1846 [Rubrobacter radiotolerans DSM 5868]
MERASSGTRVGFDTSRLVKSFFEVARDVLIRPAEFFARLRSSEEGTDFTSSGPTWRQIVFAVICSYFSFLLVFLAIALDPVTGISPPPFEIADFLSGAGLVALVVMLIFFVLFVPLFVALGLYISTFLQQLFVRIFIGRDNRSYWATFPVVAYASAVSLISWIPIVGVLIGLYAIYITTCGLRAMHDTTITRALLAALPLPAISFVLGVVPYLQAL